MKWLVGVLWVIWYGNEIERKLMEGYNEEVVNSSSVNTK